MAKKDQRVIRLERDGADYLVPKNFFDILMHRFFPVLSLTYISIVFAIAFEKHNIVRFLFRENTAYIMGLIVVLWVSVPAVIWIFLKSNPVLSHVADIWYKILAFIMVITLFISLVLFPEAGIFGIRLYFISTIPVFIVMYFLFVKGGLPPLASYPLNFFGVLTLVWGAMINVLM